MSETIKLLTLLNVAQAKPVKRKRSTARDWFQLAKKVKPIDSSQTIPSKRNKLAQTEAEMDEATEIMEEEEEEGES